MKIEHHPLAPFLPLGATTLFLGSFPPPRERWSMDFFYPNFINDFWRVMGLVHFGDAGWFEISRQARNDRRLARKSKKGFDRERIVAFCEQKGLAFFDTATAVRRLKDNASDAFLEVVEPTDVGALVARLPACRRIVTTGGKASEELLDVLAKEIPGQARNDGRGARNDGRGARNDVQAVMPPIGECVRIHLRGREIEWWRMPSTSRAYPLPLEKKADFYRRLF